MILWNQAQRMDVCLSTYFGSIVWALLFMIILLLFTFSFDLYHFAFSDSNLGKTVFWIGLLDGFDVI